MTPCQYLLINLIKEIFSQNLVFWEKRYGVQVRGHRREPARTPRAPCDTAHPAPLRTHRQSPDASCEGRKEKDEEMGEE